MPTRSLRSAPLGRHLLQSQDCVWNNEECTVKSTMISELLRKAVDEKGFISTQFADMYEVSTFSHVQPIPLTFMLLHGLLSLGFEEKTNTK